MRVTTAITARLHSNPNQPKPATGPIRRSSARPTTRARNPAPAANSSIQLVPPMENMRSRLDVRQEHLTTRRLRHVTTEGDVDGVRQAADRATALVELAHIDLDGLEPPRPQSRRDPVRTPRGHHHGAADHDRV